MKHYFHRFIRTVEDFPRPGILFRDVGPLLADPRAFKSAITSMAAAWRDYHVTKIGAFDARGFIFGSALALELGLPLFMIRKAGKLPGDVATAEYDLEYGSARVDVSKDSVKAGDHVLLVDDVLATGGTAAAGEALIKQLGGTCVGLSVVIELSFLKGAGRLGCTTHSILHY